MSPGDAAPLGRCQFRFEAARCVFGDGHPGAHVGIGGHGASVPIRGEGEIPDATYLWHPRATAKAHKGRSPRHHGKTDAGGSVWTEAMILRLLKEIHEAGVYSPHDWIANLRRLRAGTVRRTSRTKRPG
jgi:hypothetical protein